MSVTNYINEKYQTQNTPLNRNKIFDINLIVYKFYFNIDFLKSIVYAVCY